MPIEGAPDLTEYADFTFPDELPVVEHVPRLAKLNLYQEHALSGEKGFSYYSSNLKAKSFFEANSESVASAEFNAKLFELGLEDMNANIYSREAGELGENLKEKNLYVLLHGWTGNNTIYSDIKGDEGMSVVEEILAKDPNAVIVALDGNGFGGTKFRPDVLPNLQDYCTPEAYAQQVDFFITEALGYGDDKKIDVSIMGHSMGGAASMILGAQYGYDNTVALAPALFPTRENLTDIETKMEDPNESTQMEKLLRKLGYRTEGDGRYAFIGAVATLGSYTKRVLPKTTKLSTDAFFNFVGPNSMGENITGDPAKDAEILDSLLHIHGNELDTHELVAYTLTNLRRGVDFSSWTLYEVERLNRSAVFTGQEDKLVTPDDVVNLLKTISAYELIKAVEEGSLRELTEDDLVAIRAQVNAVKFNKEHPAIKRITIPGGHYAPVFGGPAVDALVQGVPQSRKKPVPTAQEI